MTEWIHTGITAISVMVALIVGIWKGGGFVKQIAMQFKHVDMRFDGLEKRMDKFETRLDRVEQDVNKIKIKLSKHLN